MADRETSLSASEPPVGVQCLRTPRLLLRPWRDEDRAPFAALNADERVSRYLGPQLNREQSDAFAARIVAGFKRHGFGLWAVERKASPAAAFIGFIGLSVPTFEAAFTPCVEIGWRLASAQWGLGLATEGARAVCRHAFEVLHLEEVVSFTVLENVASRRVMEKLGMHSHSGENFDHPRLPAGHPLRRHALYRLRSPSEA